MTFLSSHALSSSNINKTNLGDDGNSFVLEQHRKFLGSAQTCSPIDEDNFRVVVQGFSLFTGVKMNISGAVVDTLGGLPVDQRSLLLPTNFGSRVSQTIIEIAGKKVELCLVVSEVLWDLAAANLIAVVNNFKPDFVLMSGLGGNKAILETGARNQSSSMAGYSYDGSYSGSLNRPRSRRVDRRYKSKKIIPATWNFESIQSAISPMISDLGHDLILGKEGRKDNNYICNNIHYSLLQSSTEGDVELAGGLLRPLMTLEGAPAMGFFHYPSNTLKKNVSKELDLWALVIKSLIRSQLNL